MLEGGSASTKIAAVVRLIIANNFDTKLSSISVLIPHVIVCFRQKGLPLMSYDGVKKVGGGLGGGRSASPPWRLVRLAKRKQRE